MKKNKGFTLIELMVVVAIVGILAAVVLTSLGDARNKSKDSSVQSHLDTIKKQAELFYLDHSNSYRLSGTSSNTNCVNALSATGTMFKEDPTIALALKEAIKQGIQGGVANQDTRCANHLNSWAVAIKLRTGDKTGPGTKHWCVDSSGTAKMFFGSTAGAHINFPAPFFCKEL